MLEQFVDKELPRAGIEPATHSTAAYRPATGPTVQMIVSEASVRRRHRSNFFEGVAYW